MTLTKIKDRKNYNDRKSAKTFIFVSENFDDFRTNDLMTLVKINEDDPYNISILVLKVRDNTVKKIDEVFFNKFKVV